MARPRNHQLFNAVTKAAFRQFRAHGYVKTTYASIAKAAGCRPTTVQDYYPKKDQMAQAFFHEIIDITRDEAKRWNAEDGHVSVEERTFAERFRDGTLYYAYLQRYCHQYLIETTVDVALSNAVLLEMAHWAFTDSNRADVMEDPVSVERIVKSLGGFQALLNYQLSNGEVFDVQRHFIALADEWLDILGYARDEIRALISPGYLDDRDCATLTGRIDARIMSD